MKRIIGSGTVIFTILAAIMVVNASASAQGCNFSFTGDEVLCDELNSEDVRCRIDSVRGSNKVAGEWPHPDSTYTRLSYENSGTYLYYTIESDNYRFSFSINGCVFYGSNGRPIEIELERRKVPVGGIILFYKLRCGTITSQGSIPWKECIK